MKENTNPTAAPGQLFPVEAPRFTTDELIACAGREVGMRRSCYPKWDKVETVAQLKPGRAKELAMMEAIPERLRQLTEALDSSTDANRVLSQRLLAYDHAATASGGPSDDQLRRWLADATGEGCQSWCSTAVPALVSEVRALRANSQTMALALLGAAGNKWQDVTSVLQGVGLPAQGAKVLLKLRSGAHAVGELTWAARWLLQGGAVLLFQDVIKWQPLPGDDGTTVEVPAFSATVEVVAEWVEQARKAADQAHTAALHAHGVSKTAQAGTDLAAAYDAWSKLDDLYLWLFENGYYNE